MNKNILGVPFEEELVDQEKICSRVENRKKESGERDDKKLKNVKFVPIEFDYGKYEIGESRVNQALEHGYSVVDSFKTESGLVMVMGLYGSKP